MKTRGEAAVSWLLRIVSVSIRRVLSLKRFVGKTPLEENVEH